MSQPLALEDNPQFGATPDERRAAVLRLRWIARIATAAGIGIALWGAFFPRPYPVAIAALVAVPVVALALVLWQPRAFSLHERPPGGRIPLVYLHIFAIAILGIRTVVAVHVMDWPALAGVVLAGAAAIGFAIRQLEPDLVPSWRNLPTLLLGGAVFVYGVVGQADMLFDRGAPATYATTVTGKMVIRGRGLSYQLRLAPWGPTQMSGTFDVPHEFYDRADIGATVCAFVHPGALALRWYEIAACPAPALGR